MRVLQVVQKPQRRGAEIFAFHLNTELSRRDYEVRTVYLYPYQGANPLPLRKNDCILAGQENHRFEKVPGVHPHLLRNLRQTIHEFQPDIVQVNGGRAVKYGAFSRYFWSGRPWVLIYRNIGHPRDWIRGWHTYFFYRYLIMPRLHGVVGVSQATLQAVKEFYTLNIPMINIPRGVDLAALNPATSRETVRQETQTPLEAPVVIFVGSLAPEKRLDRLLRVIDQVSVNLPDLYVWLVGDGPLRSELEKQVEAGGLTHRVRFLGVQANVATYLNAADLILLTSDTEGIPGVILEAGLLGLPAVATRVGGVSECILDGETGILVDPNDEKRLVSEVFTLLQGPTRRLNMGHQAQNWTRTKFTIDKIGQAYINFYDEVLNFSHGKTQLAPR